MTIRARLLAAIVLTVIGPLVTIAVALNAFGELGDRFDEVERAHAGQGLALDLKFSVTDMNGWQTAYGYDDGLSRPKFEDSARDTEALLVRAQREFTAPRDAELVDRIGDAFDGFMALDERAWQALETDRPEVTKRILLGPELRHFDTMAVAAGELAEGQDRRAAAAARGFDEARDNAKRELVAVAIGAGVVIVLLLLTVQDVVRLALERREQA